MTRPPGAVCGLLLSAASLIPRVGQAGWTAEEGVAGTAADGAVLEIRCEGEGEAAMTLTHPVLADMPADENGRLDWYRGAIIHDGMGLDLDRPDHGGYLGVWYRCPGRSNCVTPRKDAIPHYIENLRANWTWHVRIRAPGRPQVDLRFDLAGSAAAMDAACGTNAPDDPASVHDRAENRQ